MGGNEVGAQAWVVGAQARFKEEKWPLLDAAQERREAEWRKGFLLQWLPSPVSYQCLPLTKPEFLSLLKELLSLPHETFQTLVFLVASPPYDFQTTDILYICLCGL